MKVICIDAKNFLNPCPKLEEGKIYETLTEEMYAGVYSYTLKEFGWKYLYSAWRFVPISKIDETELVNQLQQTH